MEKKLTHAACTYWNLGYGKEEQEQSPCGNPDHFVWKYYIIKEAEKRLAWK